ncbi:hypothetical protein PACTADRAFT_44475 [Pachysolen tannophilus NRRL Y-2460]|uniref:SH3 domain-containing protein n=1 Tax=Pachysolen tannophilus NRRL Y-2460 TaxID=669874 RepID=A0A1E4TQS4_PACTA|nr:hypothetical protein PACTADRAFT_44475 [Pachysolen tannophilus NRRL Y-2460]
MSAQIQLPCRAKAIYSWSGEEETDLGILEGDLIEVSDFGDGKWWYGKLKRNKMEGIFPSNYVKLLTASESLNDISKFNNKMPSFMSYQDLSSVRESKPTAVSRRNFKTTDYGSRPKKDNLPIRHSTSGLPQSYSISNVNNHLKDFQDKEEDDSLADCTLQTYHEELSRSYREAAKNPLPRYYSVDDFSRPYGSGRNYNEHREPNNSRINYSQIQNYNDLQESFIAPYDPDTLKVSKSSDGSGQQAAHQQLNPYNNSAISTDTERSSYFGHSDFSATSAGSFARHKYQLQLEEQDSKLRNIQARGGLSNIDSKEQQEIVDQIFVNKKSKHPKFLKKLFKNEVSDEVSLDQQIHFMSMTKGGSINSLNKAYDDKFYSHFKPRGESLQEEKLIDLERCRSISPKEKAEREKRILEENPYLILKPYNDITTNINTNEVIYKSNYNIDSIPLYHVDTYVRNLSIDKFETYESIAVNSIGNEFELPLEKLRALFIFCAERFVIQDPLITESFDKKVPPNDISDIIYNKHATSYQLTWLFKLMANALNLKTDIVLGYLKHPFKDSNFYESYSDKLIPNHTWLAVLIEGEWRFIDVALANLTNDINLIFNNNGLNNKNAGNESFYFLTKPLDLIYSHIPTIIDQQHIVPPIDTLVALSTPATFPSFFYNSLKPHKFNNALIRLRDLETSEFEMLLPIDVEVFANIRTEEFEKDNCTLAQVYWKNNCKRIVKVKACLPSKFSTAFVQIFAGEKGAQKTLSNIHPIAMTVPIYHNGIYRDIEFVKRYPTIHSQLQDLYIKSPQMYNIKFQQKITFIVNQFPSQGLTSIQMPDMKRPKIAIQSPSGKISKFIQTDPSLPFGEWVLDILVQENGIWRALIITDDGTGWSVFAEWKCSND